MRVTARAVVVAFLLMAAEPPSRADIALIEKAVKEQLRDPDSARFDWPNGFVRYMPANGVETWATCGTVNAKNGYGGYTGKVAVLGAIDNGVAKVAIDPPELHYAPVRKTCADIGVPVGD